MMQAYAGPVQQGDMVVRANEVSPGITALLSKQNRKGAQGIYELPTTKPANPDYYNMALGNVQNDIRSAAQTANAMAPQGERLAFINPEEEGILRLLGGSGEPEPVTGIPSFARGRAGATGNFASSKAGQTAAKVAASRSTPTTSTRPAGTISPGSGYQAGAGGKTTSAYVPPSGGGGKDSKPVAAPEPKEEKNIIEKVLSSIFPKPSQEVQTIWDEVGKKIDEVKNDPNLTNFQKNQLIEKLKFARSPEGRSTGYSMGELSKMIMSGVDQSRLGSIRLGGKDAKQLLDAGVISKENYDQALANIEKYGRGVVFDPVKKILKTAPPTGGEWFGDITRGAGDLASSLLGSTFLGRLLSGGEDVEKEPSESDKEFQSTIEKILAGSGYGYGYGMDPGTARAMYGQEKMLDYAGLSPAFFDPATKGIGFNLGTGQFGEGVKVGEAALSPQVAGAIDRVMNPKDGGGNNIPTVVAPVVEEAKTTEDALPYFSYARKFQQPMTYADIIKRAYQGTDKPLLETLQEAIDRQKATT